MVSAALDDTNAATLYGVAAGLERVDGTASRFHGAIYYLASDVEEGKPPASGLAEITMRSALRATSRASAFVAPARQVRRDRSTPSAARSWSARTKSRSTEARERPPSLTLWCRVSIAKPLGRGGSNPCNRWH